MKKIILPLLFVALLAAACNKTSNNDNSQNQNAQSQPAPGSQNPSSQYPTSQQHEIDMGADGFNPSTITVKQGDWVVFVNKDTQPHWPASNPHPTHTDLPGFDALRRIARGDSYKYQFKKAGTWGFHDHLNPSNGGSVTVQ